ncbi:DUF3558 domain-containing protein [Prauserella cavernicola]|uniref:DUF3558 domain-containing protein n=1 Tax=Prauserella cavernicola TaxID=2800127 RepID=A0A934V8A9_9PSEU|nr:DUF3558 domain-containing protein [Prauserella cavernicola]MBK1788514.1 DUF3558 domain-containing protein [Prauserella cavernicola]
MGRVSTAMVGFSVLLVAGCSGGTGGEALPAPQSSGTSSTGASSDNSELPHSGAPAVANPLPEAVISGDPCEALTAQQVEEALGDGASQGERKDLDDVGPRCSWSDPTTGGGFSLTFSNQTRQGLSAYYANTQPQSAVFRDAGPIDGLPAVEYKTTEDDVACGFAVGLADEYAVGIVVTLSRANEGNDACEPAKRVAAMAVGNLKGE